MTFFASSSLFTSSRLDTNTSTLPFCPSPSFRISSLWDGSRITLVTFHDLASINGVMCSATFPCPPSNSTLGEAIWNPNHRSQSVCANELHIPQLGSIEESGRSQDASDKSEDIRCNERTLTKRRKDVIKTSIGGRF